MINQTGSLFRYSARSLLVHPLTLFVGVWSLVVFLYSLHLSELLVYSTANVLDITLWIVVPYVISVLAVEAFYLLVPPRGLDTSNRQPINPDAIDRKLLHWFIFWIFCTVLEIIASGGLPIVWLFQGSSKTYFDFGIPSVHGLLNSMLLAIGIGQFGLFALDGKKRHLWIPAWIFLWSILAITRNMMIVLLLECTLVWGLVRGVRKRFLLQTVAGVMALVLLIGYLGDFRNGADTFRRTAEPSVDYPDWLPSGVLWVYIYLATPVANLVNTATNVTPKYDLLFPNTGALLFPTVLRKFLYGDSASTTAQSGELVVEALNASTAFVGPYQDFGHLGVVAFSILFGLIAAYSWKQRTFGGALIYAVLGQCVILSVFFNHLFDLPIISQTVWLLFFFRGAERRKIRYAARDAARIEGDSHLGHRNLTIPPGERV
ncbi:MAG: O-antigen polymerase [Candidatus Sulfotelmatobacter sp.]